ncbi:hypothetical protein [Streptomyces sp. NPDC086519]|uniref:hypothetical protein n=1 Tax=Streptomyces sp. NPDC086519 TaxID=3154863 RepID=UPI003413CEAC
MAEQAGGSAGGDRPAKRGRKFGPLRARSKEYEDLARFLRTCMADAELTLAALEGPTNLRTSAISERLSGLKIDADFVEAVVVACTEADELRPRRGRLLKHGGELLRIAMSRSTQVVDLTGQPRLTRNAVVAAMDSAVQAQLKLVDLHEQLARKNDELATLAAIQYQSQQALRESDALSSVLSTWVVVLADEVERLGRERESAMTAQPPDLGRLSGLDTELARTVAQHGRTAAELARAQQDRTLATALLAEALIRTRRARDEVRSLRAAAQLPSGGGGLAAEPSASLSDGIASPNTFGDDIDAALDRAEAVGRSIADRLHTALTTLDEGARTEPLSVPSSATDNPDNAVTGEDPTDNALWWDLLADVPTDTFVWAEETAVGLVRDRDPLDPRFGRIAREHSVRAVLLLADRLQEHRWLEGAARTRVALALSLGPEKLLPLINALIRSGPLLNRAEQGAQLLRVALAGRTAEDTLELQYRLDHRAETPPVVRDAIAAIAQRPYAEVVALVRRQLTDNPRLLTHGLLMETIVRKWPPAEVIDLVRKTMDIEGAYVVGHVFFALPTPPADQTELLVRLWATAPSHPWISDSLSRLYPAGASSDDLAQIIKDLHADWPAPLDRAARELADQIMPLIIARTPLQDLSAISDSLTLAGLSPESVFEPYRRLLVPDFVRGYADPVPEA